MRVVVGVGKVASVLRAANSLAGCDLRVRDRRYVPSELRKAAYAAARALTGRSFPEIGKVFERNHGTVISGIRTADDALVELIKARAGRAP